MCATGGRGRTIGSCKAIGLYGVVAQSAAGLLIAVALLATLRPALVASSVDPVRALQNE